MEMEISFPGSARVDAAWGDYVIRTDQPPQGGGEGSAPAPFDLFLASIGTCAGIYILGFCRQRGIPTADICLRQGHDFDPRTGMIHHITLDILLPPDFPAKYAPALVKTAQLCAVKSTWRIPLHSRLRPTSSKSDISRKSCFARSHRDVLWALILSDTKTEKAHVVLIRVCLVRFWTSSKRARHTVPCSYCSCCLDTRPKEWIMAGYWRTRYQIKEIVR